MKYLKTKKGFTLIELIVAIAIISVMSTILIAALDPIAQFQKANDARRKSDLSQIQRVLEQYYNDNGAYPASDSSYNIKALDGSVVDWGDAWSSYINILPKDPNNSKNYVYYSTGQSYWLYTNLDRGSKDLQACTSGSECSSITENNITPSSCGGSCNFGLSSPNVVVDTATPSNSPTSAPTPTSAPGSTPTSTPIPTSTPTPTSSQTCVDNAYRDEDGDGYTVGPLSLCYTGSPPVGWTLTPSAQADCYDKNANAHSGQTQYFTAARGTSDQGNDAGGNTWNSYDYNCNGAQDSQYGAETFQWEENVCDSSHHWGHCGWPLQTPSCGQSGYLGCTGCGGVPWSDCTAVVDPCSASLSNYVTNGCR